MRGLKWIFYPTTLLAQSDSCIGSKSSINSGDLKNILGTFNPPKRVILDVNFLETLKKEDIYSGIGEMIKVRDSGVVTKGSFGRSLEQARNNLRKSVYTLVFSNYMGFYDPKLLESLSKICEMLIGLKGHAVSTSKLQEITQLVEEICGGFTGQ